MEALEHPEYAEEEVVSGEGEGDEVMEDVDEQEEGYSTCPSVVHDRILTVMPSFFFSTANYLE